MEKKHYVKKNKNWQNTLKFFQFLKNEKILIFFPECLQYFFFVSRNFFGENKDTFIYKKKKKVFCFVCLSGFF